MTPTGYILLHSHVFRQNVEECDIIHSDILFMLAVWYGGVLPQSAVTDVFAIFTPQKPW